MGSEWISIPASDFCLSVRDGTHDSPKEVLSGGKNLVTSRHIKGGLLDLSTSYKISGSDYEEINKRSKVDQWDILFSMIGTVGEVLLVKEPPDFAIKNVGLFKSKDEITGKWLYYYLQSPNAKEEIYMSMRGSTQQYIPLGALRSFPIRHPQSTGEMREITNILGTLDDKIELNRKTNETLEAMAKALFKSWFVDFDPVRAKAEGRPTGLPAEISDLFPDSFEDSELGEIPSGWSIGTIGNAVGEVFDGPHATPKEASDGYVFLGIKNMTGSSLDLSEKRWIGLDDWDQWTKRVVPTSGDIVFTYEAALGLFAVIPSGLTCCLGRRMALIRPRGDEPTPYFWFHQFIAEPFQRLIEERSIHGATVNRTPLTEFPQYPVLSAPIGIRNLFDSTASALWSRINLGSNETEKLASTRDALLPKLISGEIRIPDAEKMREEVGV
jgi:type I restriction enzyme S subunit